MVFIHDELGGGNLFEMESKLARDGYLICTNKDFS